MDPTQGKLHAEDNYTYIPTYTQSPTYKHRVLHIHIESYIYAWSPTAILVETSILNINQLNPTLSSSQCGGRALYPSTWETHQTGPAGG